MKFDMNRRITTSLADIVISEASAGWLADRKKAADPNYDISDKSTVAKTVAKAAPVAEKPAGGERSVQNAIDNISGGAYGKKLYDKLHPEEPDTKYEAVRKLAAKRRGLQAEKEALTTDLNKSKIDLAKTKAESDSQHSVEHAIDNTKKIVKEFQTGERNVQNIPGNIVKTGAGKIVKELQTGERNVQNIPGHFRKFAKQLDTGERNVQNIPGNIKKFVGDNLTLDPDKIDIPVTGAAIAAGLGALALRKRLKKVR